MHTQLRPGRVLISLIAILLLAPARFAQAQSLVEPPITDGAWLAQYWNNTNLSGLATLERYEGNLDVNWGTGSPSPDISTDHFSARWRRYINLSPGTYRFSATSDDGIRVRVDGNLIIDQWSAHSAQTYTADKSIDAGPHLVSVEYFEDIGNALVRLSWIPVAGTATAWRGEYYGNTSLSGTPTLVRDDNDINFFWADSSPAPGVIPNDHFSARWTRTVNLKGGVTRFSMTVDDGGRLWINNQLVIDAWITEPATTYTADLQLPDGPATLRMEYFENASQAVARLNWTQLSSSQPTPTPTPAILNWRGEYYGNPTLTGNPALIRDDPEINFDWGTGSPAPGVLGSNNYSVRWTRTLNLPAGWYRFVMRADDGGRLWVNDQLLLNGWRVQAATTYTGDVYLTGGATPVRMEYFQDAGLASANLTWAPVPVDIRDWRGEYFANETLYGAPALVRNDTSILFNWGPDSPAPGIIDADHFSARWTRTLNLTAGKYRFTMVVDDGGRLWVNDKLVLDAWRVQGPTPYEVELQLPQGENRIRMEYFEDAGWATAQLNYVAVPDTTTPTTTTVDDTDTGFVKSGPQSDWHTAPGGMGNRMTWTRSTSQVGPDTNLGIWYPALAPGRYEVFVYIPFSYTTTAGAHYLISHAGGVSERVISQSENGDRWVSLGVYDFRGTRDDYVALSDATTGDSRTSLVGYDAMQWQPR